MKYKVGDKARVRSDIIVNGEYGGWYFEPKMSSNEGMTLTASCIDPDDYYVMDDDSEFRTDEMLEDVEEEFKLPDDGRWCVKATRENISILGDYWDNGCKLGELYSRKDMFPYWIGRYWCSYNLISGNLLFSENPGSNHIIKEKPNGLLEITFDQFKKYVLKESESTQVKEDVKFEVGKWYKHENGYYGKLMLENRDNKFPVKFPSSEYITQSGEYNTNGTYFNISSMIPIEVPLSEIQQYLPEDHPDKIKKRTKKVEDLKYPDAVHCVSKEERELLS